jgi:myosin-15
MTICSKNNYFKKGGNILIDSKNDANDFRTLISAIDILGFSSFEKETIFKVLAAILHIGNIKFSKKVSFLIN